MSVLPLPLLNLAPLSDESPLENPTARFFLAPLLHVMAEATKYQPRKVVFTGYTDGTIRGRLGSRCVVFDDVLRLAGFNPYDELSLPAPLHSRTKPVGMYRRIWYARRDSSATYLAYAPKKGAAGIPLFRGEGDHWSLTEAGVAVAATIRTSFTTKNNVTQVWLSGRLTESFYEELVANLSRSPSLCRESPEDIRGHISAYMASVIKNDTFAPRIIKGQPPTKRQLKEWCQNRAISAFRHRSRTPLGREMYGARTKAERESGQIGIEAQALSNFTQVLQEHRSSETSGSGFTEQVIVDMDATEKAEHQIAFETVMDRLRPRVFQLFKPGAADRYERIYQWMVEGITQQELAEREDVQVSRAANLMAEVRTVLRRAAQATEDACVLLTYIQEEPFSTLEDLVSDLPKLETDHSFLVGVLVERGRLQKSRGSFTVTTNGTAFLNQWSDARGSDMALRLSL